MNSKSRSEMFNPYQEEVASGFRIEPRKQTQVLEVTEDSQGHYCHRSSHSGPLVNRSQWKARNNEDCASKVSTEAGLSAVSCLTGSGNNVLPEDASEKIGAQLEVVAPAGRSSKSGNEQTDGPRICDQYRMHGHVGSYQKEDERGCNMDRHIDYGSKGNKIHYSGPLLRPSGNADQMLKDHDRRIQEVFRQARIKKSKARRAKGEGSQMGVRPLDLGVIPVFPSSRRSVSAFSSSRGAAQ